MRNYKKLPNENSNDKIYDKYENKTAYGMNSSDDNYDDVNSNDWNFNDNYDDVNYNDYTDRSDCPNDYDETCKYDTKVESDENSDDISSDDDLIEDIDYTEDTSNVDDSISHDYDEDDYTDPKRCDDITDCNNEDYDCKSDGDWFNEQDYDDDCHKNDFCNHHKKHRKCKVKIVCCEGPKGPKGCQGDPGATGPRGPMGPMGPRGPRGSKGDPGSTGARGPIGPMGPRGPRGSKGDCGCQGSCGCPGPRGPRGPRGCQGDPGAAGPRGPIGPRGPRGAKGDPGSTGARGPRGLKGDCGCQGSCGCPGPRGPRGHRGCQGDPGATGPRGPMGPRGPRGAKGDPGSAGPSSECKCVSQMRNILEQIMCLFPNAIIDVAYENGGHVSGVPCGLTPNGRNSGVLLLSNCGKITNRINICRIAYITVRNKCLIDCDGRLKICFLPVPDEIPQGGEADCERAVRKTLKSLIGCKVNVVVGGTNTGYQRVRATAYGVALLSNNIIVSTCHIEDIK
ncbi:hypothetical protein D4Z93_07755 [Clostridium fermenticellae]|uniref:Collagen-like protein n=1 Tax=Clostridium fermenticellae TaxID=2068654 RepID=A0A386H4K8_9CLOT|nr:hypothetical protein [Clostridium fermenticellae]AYD40425.1 hypothetical protein D4Z93_07755 [Clostridium fermenticellae]